MLNNSHNYYNTNKMHSRENIGYHRNSSQIVLKRSRLDRRFREYDFIDSFSENA